ncbi:MAG TPA: error-prone DNA polymerase [Chiayiivirga sp.]|nr:error-prone DNA polymerase [Chiayiivirga sp.]
MSTPAYPESDALELPAYAELHCLSDFSFLRGAANADALFERAQRCGYQALAITDECSLAGIVRAWEAARRHALKLIVGSEFMLECGLKCVLLVESQSGYTQLCELITRARRAAPKGHYHLSRQDMVEVCTESDDAGLFALWLPGARVDPDEGHWLKTLFGERAVLAVELHRDRDDAARLAQLMALAEHLSMRAVACGDVHMDVRGRRALQDTLTAIRHALPLAECGAWLFRNGERHLRTRSALAAIYPRPLLDNAVHLAQRCHFDLDQLHYQHPSELVPAGYSPSAWLRELTERGARQRWPEGVPATVVAQIEDELALIAELNYEAFFLTVEDIVRFARGRGILCQGRGSAANSAVCFALGITVVNPAESRLLMARFLSRERHEPPDIDVDFEHERREEVLQYIYAKYGRDRAALAATVIRYRSRSAMRDAARAFGLPADQITALAACHAHGQSVVALDERLREAGFDPANPLIRRVVAVAEQLRGQPRHLSQHVGGFIISEAPLSTLVPVENAAMAGRTLIQWDKDDLETLRLLKVDCLALGMLSCIRKALDLIEHRCGTRIDLAQLPGDDAATWAMIQSADTVGVFQIESRAQMSMLPRLKPARFHDLVVQVAIVRPGPIQGDMVHPYLRRRQGKEAIDCPEALRDILDSTLGIPLFQEQVMELVMRAADYSPEQADRLRRSMAAWGRGGDMESHRADIRERMTRNGYASAFIERILEQIKGFGSYGFPQSHAASFAKLVYISAWLKCHEPAAFACALLNAQPMGFYSPSQIVQDIRRAQGARAGVEIRAVDVQWSHWDCTLEHDAQRHDRQGAIRLGLRQVAGLSRHAAHAIAAARAHGAFVDVNDLCVRATLDAAARRALADAGALQSLAGDRHRARWQMAGHQMALPLGPMTAPEEAVALPSPKVAEDVVADYRSLGLSLRAHPLTLLRTALRGQRVLDSHRLRQLSHGRGVHFAGIVTQRQRPSTAKGTTFVTLEDEHGSINVIVWPDLAVRCRRPLLGARLLAVRGRWERVDGVEHLIARDLHDLSHLLGHLHTPSRDFH